MPYLSEDFQIYSRLRRSLSTAKRCYYCGKMIYFNILKCKTCRISLHDSCSEKHSCCQFTSSAGMVLRCSTSKDSNKELSIGSPNASESETSHSTKVNQSDIYSKVAKWLSIHLKKKDLTERNRNLMDEKHAKSRYNLKNPSDRAVDSRTTSSTRKRLKILLKNASSGHTNAIAKAYHLESTSLFYCSKCNLNLQNSLCHKCSSICKSNIPQSPECTIGSRSSATISPDFLPSSGYISASSSLTQTPSFDQDSSVTYHPSANLHQRLSPTVLLPDPKKKRRQVTLTNTKSSSGSKYYCPKSRTLSLDAKERRNEILSSTWPQAGRHLNFDEDVDGILEQDYMFVPIDSCNSSSQMNVMSNSFLEEWTIPYKDLNMIKRLRNGRTGAIYSGWWHGDVLIHTFDAKNEQSDMQEFVEDVKILSMIRHENIALFMGVSVSPNCQAIVTSIRKGVTLFDHIHVKRNKLSLHTKVNIARQVAQGMGYLHAKGIIHKKLNSKNILLESKVKICMLDNGMAEKELDKSNFGCIPNGHLTYISCEMMKSLTVQVPHIKPNIAYSKETDVFAFGSVLYELVAESWPFKGQHSHSIIWQVSKGNMQDVSKLKCAQGLKSLITKCWNYKPQSRPPFSQIVKLIQDNVALHKRHSSSEPESINRIGLVQDEIIRA